MANCWPDWLFAWLIHVMSSSRLPGSLTIHLLVVLYEVADISQSDHVCYLLETQERAPQQFPCAQQTHEFQLVQGSNPRLLFEKMTQAGYRNVEGYGYDFQRDNCSKVFFHPTQDYPDPLIKLLTFQFRMRDACRAMWGVLSPDEIPLTTEVSVVTKLCRVTSSR